MSKKPWPISYEAYSRRASRVVELERQLDEVNGKVETQAREIERLIKIQPDLPTEQAAISELHTQIENLKEDLLGYDDNNHNQKLERYTEHLERQVHRLRQAIKIAGVSSPRLQQALVDTENKG